MIFADLWRDMRLQRVAALSLAAALALLIWCGIGQTALDLARDDHPIQLRTRLLAEQLRLAERVPALRQSLEEVRQGPQDGGDFLPPAAPALAAAQMQDMIGRLIRPLGGQLASVEPLGLGDEQGFRRAGLRLKLALRQDALPALLHRLEYGKPRLFLADLAVKAKGDELTVVMDVFGYLPAEAP